MQDHYYSKKLNQYFPTRLDVLLYAHDGRGFGHVSRAVAVGLALKRLYPDCRTLLVTGSSRTAMLIGPGELDWIKLPSYKTVLSDGVSEGRDSSAGFYKSVLGNLRADMLQALISILRPRCVLVDHNPFGKRRELVKALERQAESGSSWVLGLRGVIGEDQTLWSAASSELVGAHYREILWYGDGTVLGPETLARIENHFPRPVTETGYVSRVIEMAHMLDRSESEKSVACTLSLPWLGDKGDALISALSAALESIGPGHGAFHIYVPEDRAAAIGETLGPLTHCIVAPISDSYVGSLMRSRSVVVFGGYNSLLDAAAAGLPALVILRSTQDREQQEHLSRLQKAVGDSWRVIEEERLSARSLERDIRFLLSAPGSSVPWVGCSGAEKTAMHLYRLLQESS